MRNVSLIVVTVSLAGCGPNLEESCNDYVDAWIACIDEAYIDDPAIGDSVKATTEGACDVYEGVEGKDAKEAADILDCYTEILDAGDCSTIEAYGDTVGQLPTCVGLPPVEGVGTATGFGTATGGGPGTGTGTGTGTGGNTLFFGIDWVDDGQDPYDTNSDGFPDAGCNDTVRFMVNDPSGGGWQVGMAETAATNGWTGEDCFNGYATFSICHPIDTGGDEIDEVPSCLPFDVVAGQTTLLDASKEPYLTYIFQTNAGSCHVTGDAPGYYGALGCSTF